MALNITGAKKATVKTVPIRSIKACEVFYFESSKDKKNTGLYFRINSKEAKAVHLATGKSMKFTDREVGIPKTANLSVVE